jgi:SAM-dependent methyltransferase
MNLLNPNPNQMRMITRLINAVKNPSSLPAKIKRRALAFYKRIVGFRYVCPLCGFETDHFLPIEDFFKENWIKHRFPYAEDWETLNTEAYHCPKCHGCDRERIYALFLNSQIKKARGKSGDQPKMLDIAPHPALSEYINQTRYWNRRTNDLFMEKVDDHYDIEDMHGYGDAEFDCLICSHVLEHVPDDRQAMTELYRVLKPGGWAILMVPIVKIDQIDEAPEINDEAEQWRRFGQYDHLRLYNREGFITRLEEVGFIIDSLGISHFGSKIFARAGITSQSVLYIGRKGVIVA